ncbi:MAG: ABC transporter ATP-binding protein [Pseudomonadota bacterium]
MSETVIRAEGLGKSYLIGHQSEERYTALRDVIARSTKNLVRSAIDMARGRQIIVGDKVEEFWALQNVSFEIKRGDVVGIIGRNGAGKSTLLKVLSRITEPTAGRVEIKGRVASLLEVGTGFHPELTGRENIYLNGAILGMSRAEIKRKFDEIVDFAGVETFLDTPVKRYSSGMHVRLAFAVAAHLEPEILVIDEVLAVGDAEFQKKCLGKMESVAGDGRTVLLVSHNQSSIRAVCKSGIILDAGKVDYIGPVAETLDRYHSAAIGRTAYVARRADEETDHRIRSVSLESEVVSAPKLELNAVIESRTQDAVIINVRVLDALGTPVAMASVGGFSMSQAVKTTPGVSRFQIEVDLGELATGSYAVSIDVERPYAMFYDDVERCVEFVYEPAVPQGRDRVLLQSWQTGCFLLPAKVVEIEDQAASADNADELEMGS